MLLNRRRLLTGGAALAAYSALPRDPADAFSLFEPPIRDNNFYSFPGGHAPGFNPNHPLANGAVLSAVQTNNGLINLLHGTPSTVTGTPPNKIFSTIGPVRDYSGTGADSFAIASGVSPQSLTVAMIVRPRTFSGVNKTWSAFNTTGGSSSLFFGELNVAGGQVGVFWGSGNIGLITTLPTANHNYFFASTLFTTTADSVLRDLDTGQIFTNSVTYAALTFGATTGTISVGSSASDYLGAVYYGINNSTSRMDRLKLAANDPWSLWYPTYDQEIVGLAAPVGGTLRQMPLSGVGP